MTELERAHQTRRDAALWATSVVLLGLLFVLGFVLYA
jgi:hypothetical protein